MTRINTNTPSILARRILNHQTDALNQSLVRLSTGYRINAGRDDPAGLIASESLRAQQVSILAAVDNARRADTVLAVAEGGLQTVSQLLLDLEDLVDKSANEGGLNSDEVRANQSQIDSILLTINRIADSSSFGKRKLLNGDFDFVTSGVVASQIASVQIAAAKLPANGSQNVNIEVQASAQVAQLKLSAAGLAANNPVSFEIRGNYGATNLSFAGSATISAIAAAVNGSSELTGVSATLSGFAALYFTSTDYGSDALVSVRALSGTLNLTGGDTATLDHGVDPTVRINGQQASTRGLEISSHSANLSVNLILDAGFAQQTGTVATFAVVGGGATFSIGPQIGLATQESIGIGSVNTGSLGNASYGFLSSLKDGETNALDQKHFASSQRIIRAAIDQISGLRGRIGAFQSNALEATIQSLQVAYENTVAAESVIRDTDFAAETSNLTRSQILVRAATSSLQLANASPQNVLTLLG